MSKSSRFYKSGMYFLIGFLFVFGITIFIYEKYNKNNFINISSLSSEFMNTYLENNKNIKDESKENILIVTSKEKNLERYGAVNVIEAPNNQYYLQYDNKYDKEKALNKLKEDDVIVSENIVHTIDDDTVLVASYNSWGVEAMGMDTLKEKIKNKELNNIVVAIIDTGLDVELFNKNYSNRLAGLYNTLENNENMTDEVGHGTHIAGTIAESTPDNVKILPVKVSKTINIYESDIVAAVNYITYNNLADIMNMSFGAYFYPVNEYIAIDAARKQNIITAAAAGNDNISKLSYPGSFDNTICVSSVTNTLEKSSFSNFGESIMFSAPGSDIVSINGTMSGTSMATPHISSALSYLKSMNNNLSFEDTILLLRRYSDDLGDVGWDEKFGYGFVNLKDASVCDGSECDEFNVFKKSERDNVDALVKSYEITPVLTNYNYGTNNNLFNTKISLTYENGKIVDYYLGNIYNKTIEGYDPKSIEEQAVTIKLKLPIGYEINDQFKIKNPDNFESAWEYNKINDTDIELTKFKDSNLKSDDLYLPSSIDGYNVVSIADGTSTESIFHENWTAFSNVKNLYLPSTLTRVGNYAFSNEGNKNSLYYVKSDAEYLEVGDYAFYGSRSLTTIDADISYIGNYSFFWVDSLMQIRFSNNLTHIGDYAFHFGGYNTTSLTIPSSVTEMGEGVFVNSNFKQITFQNQMEIISEKMFSNSPYLEKVVLPSNIKEIGNRAFINCTKLKEINLPSGLETIGDYAFSSSLISGKIIIPSTVTSLGVGVFKSSGIEEIEILGSINDIPTSTFENSINLTKVVLPETVKRISDKAFYKCSALKEINLPNSLYKIGDYAFYRAFDNAVLTIPSDVFVYGEYIFQNSGLKEVTILNNTDLNISMFRGSDLLETVNLPDNLEVIGSSAFINCSKLKNINMPSSLYKIGANAFSDAFDSSANVELTLPETLEELGNGVFSNSHLKKITILSKITSIPTEAFSESTIEEIVLPDTITDIQDSAFYKTYYLKNINMPNSLKTIQSNAFGYTFNISSNVELVLPESLVTISSDSFAYSNIYGIKILGNITNIPDRAFYNSKYLKSVELPDSVTSIGQSAFSNCYALTYVKLSKNLETINSNAFKSSFGDDSKVIFDKLVQTIDEKAFANVDKTKVKFYVYNNTIPKEYAKTNNIIYVQIDPNEVNVSGYKNYYKSGDMVNIDNLLIEAIYNEETIRKEIIKDDINIIYNNGESFSDGDTSFKIKTKNTLGYIIEKDVNITISDKVPSFDIPTNIYGMIGEKLSSVILPDNFYWINSEEVITKDNNIYKAKYVPTDSEKYDIVENIDIKLNLKELIIPEFKIINKKYDGTTNVNINNVTINNLSDIDYEILSAVHEKVDAGIQKITIKVKFTELGYQKYGFENNNQENTFVSNIEILPFIIKYLSGEEEVIDKISNDQAIIKSNMFSNSGYVFLYWNTKEDGTGTTYNPLSNISLTDDLTLYAIWKEAKYSINYCFDENCDLGERYDYSDSEEVTIINNDNEISGKVFDSWNTNKDGTGKSFKPNEKIIIKENYILYPIYVNDVAYSIENYRVIESSKYISRIIPNTIIDTFKNNIKLKNGYTVTVETVNLDDKDVLYTGSKTIIYKGSNIEDTFINIVIGDIDGDGDITSSDLLKIRQHLIGNKILDGIYLLSADVDDDTEITSSDLLRVRQHLIGTRIIS